MTVRELIDLTGSSRATVYRDLELLVESGVPLTGDRIQGHVRHRLMEAALGATLQSHELAALALAREVLEPVAGMEMVDALDHILRRVGQVGAGDGSTPVSLSGHGGHPHAKGTIRGIDLAIRKGQRLSFDYRTVTSTSVARRIVDPVSLRLHRGQPYLIAFDIERDDWRIFKVVRITGDLDIEGEAIARPDYDEALLFKHSVGIWLGDDPVAVSIRLSAEVASRGVEYPLTAEQTITPDPNLDGAVVVQATVAGIVEALRWTLSWGAAAVVLAPSELREATRAELAGALAGYKEDEDSEAVSHAVETPLCDDSEAP